MVEMSDYFFHMLRLAKTIHDDLRFKGLWSRFKAIPLDEDAFYELVWEAATSVFRDTSVYHNEDAGVETWVLADPAVDRFCELCTRLEREKGLEEGINPYRRNAEKMIHNSFCHDSYSFDYSWRLSDQDRGRKCVLFFALEDFYGTDELPEAFMDILDGFRELNRQLEAELGLNKIIPIYPFMSKWKEAA